MPAAVAVPLISAAASTAGSVIAARSSGNASRNAMNANMQAADLEAQSAREALNFAKQQEIARQREWAATQALNERMWREQFNSDNARWAARRGDLAPFRQFGYGAIGQLAAPMPKSGTLGSLAGA